MISVILPVYNVQDFIGDCLESVISQTHKDIEIICVNDFTMDNSMSVVKEYAKRDKRIKIVHNARNRGLGGARNAGLDAASGEYIIFVDTDDKLMPDMVARLYKTLLETGADMVFCDLYLQNAANTLTPHKPFHDPVFASRADFHPQKAIWEFSDIWPSAWNKIYKKEIIDKNKLRYHENIQYEDHTFYWEYIFSSRKVTYLPESLYIYRNERSDSIMHTPSIRCFEIFSVLEQIHNIFKNHLSEHLYNILMPKIAIRLLWERYNILLYEQKKEFIKKSRKYLSSFKKQDLYKYKDWFIDINCEFLQNVLSHKVNLYSNQYNIINNQLNIIINQNKNLMNEISGLSKSVASLEKKNMTIQQSLDVILKSKNVMR